ncbi:MAG: DUF6446 family protein [Hasllibacter sp.]
MNIGRLAAAFLLLVALLGGGLIWWLQTRAYYDAPVPVTALRLTLADGTVTEARTTGTSIDATSSPLRYRACARVVDGLPAAQAAALMPAPDAAPTVAPGWFDCFDADAIGADVAAGAARAVIGVKDLTYGIDRIVALYPDGRAYAWHQINECGEVVFDGRPAPDGCEEPPEDD